MNYPTERIDVTTFVTLVVEHSLEWELAHWVGGWGRSHTDQYQASVCHWATLCSHMNVTDHSSLVKEQKSTEPVLFIAVVC